MEGTFAMTPLTPASPRRRRRATLRDDQILEFWRPRPLFLIEEFGSIRDELRSFGQRRLDKRQERYILWARAQGIGVKPIARAVRKADWRIRRFILEAHDDLGIFLDCRFVQKTSSGRDNDIVYWVCRYCGDEYEMADPATRHAWRHVFDPFGDVE